MMLQLEAAVEEVLDGALAAPVTIKISSQPEATAPSTTYWITGLSTTTPRPGTDLVKADGTDWGSRFKTCDSEIEPAGILYAVDR